MATITRPTPPTSLYFLQADAPVLMPLFSSQDPPLFMIFPSSPDFEKYHFEYNKHVTTKPLAVVFPTIVEHLCAVLKHCAAQEPPIPITLRGGGHDYHGRNVLSGAVQIDLRLMNDIGIDGLGQPSALATSVTVGPGVTSIQLQRTLAAHGLAAPTGWVGSVGVIGWASGGGYGLEAGKWGLGVDNIHGAKLVTPTGATIDTTDDPELLWAIRGAGLGNFGVISELRIKAYPSPRYLAGFVAFPLAEAQQVLGGFQQMCDEGDLPDNFSGELTIAQTEKGSIINFLFAWICEAGEPSAAGWTFYHQLKALGTVILDSVKETSVLDHHEAMNANPAFNPTGYTTIYALAVLKLDRQLIDAIANNPPPADSTSAILIHHAHGKAVQPDSNSVWTHRDRHFVVTYVGFVSPDASLEQQQQSRSWAESLYQTSSETGLTSEKSYWSLVRPEHCDAVKFFGQESVDRLVALKRKYNPRDLFPAAVPVLL